MQQGRPLWAEIDLDAIAHNLAEVRRRIGPESRIMAVVKANAYGHGSVPVARAALEAGASYLGVACVDEGVQLRQAGVTAPIVLLGYLPPWEAPQVVEHQPYPIYHHPGDGDRAQRAGPGGRDKDTLPPQNRYRNGALWRPARRSGRVHPTAG